VDFVDWIILIVVVGVGIAIIQVVVVSNRKRAMEQKLSELDDFEATQKIMGNDGSSGIAIDEGRKKACLIKQGPGEVVLDVCSYRDILAAEIFEDGQTITKTSRTSQLGGTLIGGLALGGVGAIIGGLSGKQVSSQKPSRIDLRIAVNRTESPLHDINFMNTECAKDGIIYTLAMQQARHWHGLIAVLIRRADEEDKNAVVEKETRPQLSSQSVSDELRKLVQLKAEGVLTEEEFAAQKVKLLG
jgi:hypothetical protein